jgi:hypothetical protein
MGINSNEKIKHFSLDNKFMISSSRETSLVISDSRQKSFSTTSCGVDKTTHTTKVGTIDVDDIENKIWVPTLGPRCFVHETPYYGKTVVAGEPISKGTRIYKCIGEILDHPTLFTVQINESKHVNCTQGTCEYTCASCDPNAKFQLENDEELVLIALRDIQKGEQITFNYCLTEWKMANPFKCLCGAKNCLGYVAGFSKLPEEFQKELFPEALPHIQRLALREGLIEE